MNEVFERFKKFKMCVEGRSQNTLSMYYDRIKEFCNDLNLSNEEEILGVKATDISQWLIKLANERENGERTRNIKLSTIKEFYRYLREEEEKNVDYKILKMHFAKIPQKESKYIDSIDKEDFLNSIRNPLIKLSVALCIETGMRFSELMQITIKGIEDGKQIVTGKGNKERPIYFKPYVVSMAKDYIKRYRSKIDTDTEILLVTKMGKPLTKQGFSQSLKVWGKKFNDDPLTEGRMDWWKELSPHKLRHSYATHEFERGIDAPTIQRELGHNNLSTTSRYAHSSEARVKRAMLGIEELD